MNGGLSPVKEVTPGAEAHRPKEHGDCAHIAQPQA